MTKNQIRNHIPLGEYIFIFKDNKNNKIKIWTVTFMKYRFRPPITHGLMGHLDVLTPSWVIKD